MNEASFGIKPFIHAVEVLCLPMSELSALYLLCSLQTQVVLYFPVAYLHTKSNESGNVGRRFME
jgi:hypothetical protein